MKQLSQSDIDLLLTSNYEIVSKFIDNHGLDGIDVVVGGHRLRIFVFVEGVDIKYDTDDMLSEYKYYADGTTSVIYSYGRR